MLDDENFVANFVARHGVLDALLRQLRAGCALHHVLVGPRGMGKTSLLRRLAIAVNDEPELAERYVPLRFREEQYNVLTLGAFWHNCGEALAEWAECTDRDALARRLDADLTTSVWAAEATAAERLDEELNALGRRAILLVDNVDLILDALTVTDNWTLRRRLQARRGPIMICAATQPLRHSADRDAAFYEFFQPHHLEPLGERETEGCMRALAKRRGEHGKPVVEVLNKQPERLKTLHTLTGGNPRVLALIYRLLETAESEAAMADLEILLDQVTPYYKAKIEEYATSQQRAVIDAISLNWDPITTGDLSLATKIPSTTLSPLLIKLRKDGLIENVGTSGSYAGHQLVERFFNIWYLMRHGTRRAKQKMRWLVGFLESFYSSQELVEIASRAHSSDSIKTFNTDYAFALREAVARQRHVYRDSVRDGLLKSVELTASADPSAIEHNKKALIKNYLMDAEAVAKEAVYYLDHQNFAGGEEALEKLIARFSDAKEGALRGHVAWALISKAFVRGQMGDRATEISIYDEVFSRFAGAKEVSLRQHVAMALISKALALDAMGDRLASVAAYDDAIVRFADAEDVILREQVAVALNNKAFSLCQMVDGMAAVAVCDDVIARFANDKEPVLRSQVGRAMVIKGFTLGQMGDRDKAIENLNGVIVRYDNAEEGDLRTLAADARILIANMLFDVDQDLARAESLYLEATSDNPLLSYANLTWLYLSADRPSEAAIMRRAFDGLPDCGVALLDAATELASANFGAAAHHLSKALNGDIKPRGWDFSDDLDRLLRLADQKGFGTRLIEWFEQTGLADRLAPVYAAFKAYVGGEQVLLDVNPEVRRPAKVIFDRLDAPRRHKRKSGQTLQIKTKRGRLRKAQG